MDTETQNKNMKNLQALLAMMDTQHLTRADFEAQFKKVLEMLIEMKKRFEAQAQALSQTIKQAHDGSMGMIANKADTSVAESKKAMMDYCEREMATMMKTHEAKMKQMDEKMDSLHDGMDADQEAMTKEVVATVTPTITTDVVSTVEKDLPKFGTAFRDGLELLQGNDRLDKKSIKGLDEMFKDLESRVATAFSSRAVGGLISTRVISPTILATASTIDGSNLQFVFDKEPTLLVVNGANYRKGKGWSWSGHTATLDNPVGVGGDIYAIL